MIEPSGIILPVIVFLFAAFFYFTNTLEQCWYRRYVFPALFALMALFFIENKIAVLLLLAAALLAFYGFKGTGMQKTEAETQTEKGGKEK